MIPQERLEVFGDFDPVGYEEEVHERWGGTDACRESARRTSRYARQDWEQMGREMDGINTALITLMDAGAPADGVEAMDLAERHRARITKWFYECSPEIHDGLGEMYAADPRFSQNIDKAAPGLAQYLSDVIAANARR